MLSWAPCTIVKTRMTPRRLPPRMLPQAVLAAALSRSSSWYVSLQTGSQSAAKMGMDGVPAQIHAFQLPAQSAVWSSCIVPQEMTIRAHLYLSQQHGDHLRHQHLRLSLHQSQQHADHLRHQHLQHIQAMAMRRTYPMSATPTHGLVLGGLAPSWRA